jgi:MraZ protein
MTQFMGTHTNRLDAKGRVSIPAPFRAVLRGPKNVIKDGPKDSEPVRLILRPSHQRPCIEGWPADSFQELEDSMRRMDVFSDDQDDLAFTLYASAAQVESDREGRISLSAELAAHAGLGDTLVFVGLGRKFEIWETAALEQRRAEALARAKSKALTLPATPVAAQ